MSKDYYDILGVKKDASQDEISKAYRKKAMLYHPDRQHGKSEEEKKEAEECFKKCSEAYETLSDTEKRKSYDMFGPEGMNQQGGGFGANFDPREFFRSHMRGFGSHFGFDCDDDFTGFGFGDMGRERVDPNAPKNGKTLRLNATLSFEDMVYGAKRTFDLSVEDTCEHCHGTGSEDGKTSVCQTCGGSGMVTQRHGMMIMQSTCPMCRGTGNTISKFCHVCNGRGTHPSERHFEVDIPAGIYENETIVAEGYGLKGKNGGKNGDIIIVPKQEKHEIFERDGLDVMVRITIPSLTASMGGDVDVCTPWGIAKTNIQPGTNNGKIIKLSGCGVKRGDKAGDLYAVVEIEMMSNITEEQRKILNKLSNMITKKNYPKIEKNKESYDRFEKSVKDRR